uniref:Ig-like domain-containing protein n=1 Tax=Ornithorhynchus anatinus TaxID=9258 RepID=A0A6I8P0S8_ORNAN
MEKPLGASLLILGLQLGWVSSQNKVEQTPPSLSLQEGEDGIMTCNFTSSAFNNLQWYRQDPGKGPTFLILLYSNGEGKSNGRFAAKIDKGAKSSYLNITAAQPEDSATYLCAMETQ